MKLILENTNTCSVMLLETLNGYRFIGFTGRSHLDRLAKDFLERAASFNDGYIFI